ncbi:two-component signal transduction system response regulator [Cyanobacterium sp. HL-69]|uniref:response regulator transcription factor n=1 Tax=unclassified Cyanobacterium TaxID=2629879 RepID=UPI00085263DD|nr:response regulator transcription factor [Cyanobacterium sp. IPPAS B-1200]AUC60780.1 two-component signal transduction system response regulator [Cyanobacterium sp. HL-69]OEJ78580.1 DNA-binding response regulator [Cyanobacterium sp. IPPAS B-1200]
MSVTCPKILIVDDDVNIGNLVSRFLQKKDYVVQYANDGKTAIEIFGEFKPDLVILDINLPDTLGYNLCTEMQNSSDVFVLMLTSRTDLEDKKKGFITGADDYITKPFDLEELEFRVQAILKRQRIVKSSHENVIAIDNLSINPETREVKVNQQLINLTTLEFDLLYFLANNPGKVWRREDLVTHVWDNNPIGDNRVVDVHIGQIRKKIEKDCNNPNLILTVRGVGYKFEI